MQTSDADAFLSAYTRPILWVAAQEDALLDLESQREQLNRTPASGRFVVVEDTSHVGLGWSDGVAGLLAGWATDPEGVTEETIAPQ